MSLRIFAVTVPTQIDNNTRGHSGFLSGHLSPLAQPDNT